MARHESDREDLLAEAVALVRRVEGCVSGLTIVAGFRAANWLSVYFGADPMYQFDAEGRLRRAFEDGFLYRTQGSTLARLTRQRSEGETALVRHDLTRNELTAFRQRLLDRLAGLIHAVQTGAFEPLRQVPEDDRSLLDDVVARLQAATTAEPWLAPPIGVRR